MASRTRWAWVWVNSGSWWWTGKPGMLWFMGSKWVGYDWATELIERLEQKELLIKTRSPEYKPYTLLTDSWKWPLSLGIWRVLTGGPYSRLWDLFQRDSAWGSVGTEGNWLSTHGCCETRCWTADCFAVPPSHSLEWFVNPISKYFLLRLTCVMC